MTYTVTISADSVVVQLPGADPATFVFSSLSGNHGIGKHSFTLAEALVVSTEHVIQQLRKAGQHV